MSPGAVNNPGSAFLEGGLRSRKNRRKFHASHID